MYFAFDAALHSGQGCFSYPPEGYQQFCDAYMHNAMTSSQFAYLEVDMPSNPQVIKNRQSPTFEEILGPGITDLHGTTEKEGGCFVEAKEVEMIDWLVMDAAKRLQYQDERIQKNQ